VGNGVVRCTDTDGDGCVEWSQPEACPAGQSCLDGRCTACTPNCADRECGDNGCGGSCGTCPGNLFCDSGKCVDECFDECWWGESWCWSESETVECGEFDEDPCMDYSPPIACPEGRCNWETGRCGGDCWDECWWGESHCINDGESVECGQWDADACLEFGPPQRCPDGNCDWQTGRCGGDCWDECFWGESWCWSEWEVAECGQWDADSCLEFSPPLPCPQGFCDWDTGQCGGDCWDECGWGESFCFSDSEVVQCGEYDGDPCTEFSPPTRCPNGRCNRSTGRCRGACSDECTWGERYCIQDWAWVECGEWDGDPCLEFSPPMECPPDAPCDWATGQCSQCWDECWWGERSCWDERSTVQCGQYDTDACLEFGPPTPCPPGATCDWRTGVCSGQNGRDGAGQYCSPWAACPADWNAAWTCVEYPGATEGFCSYPCQGDDECALDFPSGCCRELHPGHSVCMSDPDLCQVPGAGYQEWCTWGGNETCLPDMFCIEGYLGQDNVCLFTCDRAMGICPLGGNCLPVEEGSATGVCMPTGTGQFGDVCTLAEGCVSGLLCTPLDETHPGYCNTMCNGFLACPNGFDCVLDDGSGGRWCAELCSSQVDCNRLGDWECVWAWGPDTGVCLPRP
jgi:hypothetical protein